MQPWIVEMLLGASAASFILGSWVSTMLAVRRIEQVARANMPLQNVNVWQRAGAPVVKARRSVVHETEKMFASEGEML